MSLISDALKKAEQQRSEPPRAVVNDWSPAMPTATPAPQRRRSPLYLTNVIALLVVGAFAIYFFRVRPDGSFSSERAGGSSETAPMAEVAAPLTSSSASPTLAVADSLPARDPAPASTVSAPSSPPTTSDYDLVGTSGVGSTTLLSIARREDKRSLWVPVGKTVAEVTAVSYDPESDRAVIRVRGNLMTVVTREVSGAPAPTPPAQAAE